jgi:hypothetical protein
MVYDCRLNARPRETRTQGGNVRSRGDGWRRLIPRGAAAGCIALLLGGGPAFADDDGGFFGRVLNNLAEAAAKAAWQGVDPAVQNCMMSQYNLNPADLADQGILPMDPRVSQDVANCQQLVAGGGGGQQAQQVDPAQRLQELTAKYGAKAAKKIAAGNIDMGFTQDEVTDAWGNPDDRKQGAKGKEIWVYGQDNVTFTHGKVSAVGH